MALHTCACHVWPSRLRRDVTVRVTRRDFTISAGHCQEYPRAGRGKHTRGAKQRPLKPLSSQFERIIPLAASTRPLRCGSDERLTVQSTVAVNGSRWRRPRNWETDAGSKILLMKTGKTCTHRKVLSIPNGDAHFRCSRLSREPFSDVLMKSPRVKPT